MHWLRVLGFGLVSGMLATAAGCATTRDAKSASGDDNLGFDESGTGRKCDTPSATCEEVSEPSLDFQEKCREGGFRMRQCGCDDLCTGNINGEKIGFNSKNEQKICRPVKDNCELAETSAAYQDACDAVGGEMIECGCDWLCSKKLAEAIPDAPKEDEKKADDAAGDEKKDEKAKDEKAKDEKAKDEKPRGNMDGKAPEAAPKDDQSGDSHGDKKKKKKSRFFDE